MSAHAYIVSSKWEIYHREIEKIKQRLVDINTPMQVIDDTVCKYIKQLFEQREQRTTNNITLHLAPGGQ